HLLLAERDGDVVGQAFLYPLSAWFGGREVRVGGVASVAVAPEARGTGVAAALLARLHARSDRRRDALTMLYAFRDGFYARHGYAPTSTRHRLAVAAGAIPAEYRLL